MKLEKKLFVDLFKSYIDSSNYLIIVDYTKMMANDATKLRSNLRSKNARLHIVKNKILQAAIQDIKIPDLKLVLTGQNAIVFGGNEFSEVTKIVSGFFKNKSILNIKYGILDNRILSQDEIINIANLPGLQESRVRLIGVLRAPMMKIVNALRIIPCKFIETIKIKWEI